MASTDSICCMPGDKVRTGEHERTSTRWKPSGDLLLRNRLPTGGPNRLQFLENMSVMTRSFDAGGSRGFTDFSVLLPVVLEEIQWKGPTIAGLLG